MELAWKESTDSTATVSESTIRSDARKLMHLVHAISRDNVSRAVLIIKRFLNSNSNVLIKQGLSSDFVNASESTMNEICQGIRDSITHHTNPNGGTRSTSSDAYVKDIASAAVWSFVKKGEDVPITSIQQLTNLSSRQIKSAVDRVKELIATNKRVGPYKRAQRKDKVVDKVIPYIWRYLQDDKYTRLDSNQGMYVTLDPTTKKMVNVHKRVWLKS